jgi:hypothetical protein
VVTSRRGEDVRQTLDGKGFVGTQLLVVEVGTHTTTVRTMEWCQMKSTTKLPICTDISVPIKTLRNPLIAVR